MHKDKDHRHEAEQPPMLPDLIAQPEPDAEPPPGEAALATDDDLAELRQIVADVRQAMEPDSELVEDDLDQGEPETDHAVSL